MSAGVLSFFQRPRWVVTIAIALAVIVWAAVLYSIGSQIGHPFPGFFHGPDGDRRRAHSPGFHRLGWLFSMPSARNFRSK